MNGIEDRVTPDVADEHTVLASIMAILTGAGAPAEKIDEAVAWLRMRLRMIEGRIGAEHFAVTEVDEPDIMPRGRTPARRKDDRRGETPVPRTSLIGDSPAMTSVHEAIRRVSHSQATVLLRGESGTGKELVARAIHRHGPRAQNPFVPLHCAAVSDTLLESELFGHERGAFTGAVEVRKGRFELAEGGTLFLDEIGDIPTATQVKLLRVLQEKCFERVGGSRSIAVDVRVISATHRDLEAMVRMGAFREDLYYRLNVVPIVLPPLRERDGDVPLLIEYFLARVGRDNRRRVRLGHDLLGLMTRYHWPGNVRELQNCIERLVVMADPDRELITLETIPASLRGYFADMKQVTGADESGPIGRERMSRAAAPLGARLQEIERDRLVETLKRTGWIQARAARALGMTPRQVAYKMKKYGLAERAEH